MGEVTVRGALASVQAEDIRAGHLETAFRGFVQAPNQVQESRLATAGRPHKRYERGGLDDEAHASERLGSFKNMMIAQFTDSYMGHLQVHRKGYVAAVESLPLTMNLKQRAYRQLEEKLKGPIPTKL